MPELLAQINVIVLSKNNAPAVELRMVTNQIELIKKIVSCAMHNTPIVLMPVFSDKLKSVGSLIEKGLVYVKDGDFYFTV